MTAIFQDRRRVRHSWDLLFTLVSRDVKLKYRRSVIGIAWSLLNPLLQLLVFQVVFTTVLPLNVPDYTAFLFIGILVWGWFQSSLMSAASAVVDNGQLIRQPGFSESVLPVVSVVSNLINFVLAFPIVLVFLLWGHHALTTAVAGLPLVIAVQLLFTLSLSYLLAGIHVRFRDTQYLIGVILMLGFYLAPVFYQPRAIPPQYRTLYGLNPMVHIITSYRTILIDGVSPDWRSLFVVAGLSSVLLLWTLTIFRRVSHSFMEEL